MPGLARDEWQAEERQTDYLWYRRDKAETFETHWIKCDTKDRGRDDKRDQDL